MKILKLGNLLIICGLLFSCRAKTIPQKRHNEIVKICFAAGGCYGSCPFLAIEIDSGLNYKYFGGKYTKKHGYYFGKVTEGFWDTLNIKFEKLKYKQLDTLYEQSADDLATEIIIYYGKRKHIIGQSMSLPDSVMKLYDWLIGTDSIIKLNRIVDSTQFKIETKIQKGPPPPPPSKMLINQLRVIPPVK
jgi:hypothetical protein